MVRVDLNCDMGESFGAWSIGSDSDVLPHVTSINVACGFHAGDPSVMRATVHAAAAHGVAVGAHPGLPDLIGFGRRDMAVSPQDVYDMVVYQLGALQAIAATEGVRIRHVKPHGALYNMAAVRRELADAIARAMQDVDATLMLVGLCGSELIRAGTAIGLPTAREVFADRNYRADGMLVPRAAPGAVITDVDLVTARALRMVLQRTVTTIDGTELSVAADTICIHGDAPGAPQFAQRIRSALHSAGVAALPLGDAPHA